MNCERLPYALKFYRMISEREKQQIGHYLKYMCTYSTFYITPLRHGVNYMRDWLFRSFKMFFGMLAASNWNENYKTTSDFEL